MIRAAEPVLTTPDNLCCVRLVPLRRQYYLRRGFWGNNDLQTGYVILQLPRALDPAVRAVVLDLGVVIVPPGMGLTPTVFQPGVRQLMPPTVR